MVYSKAWDALEIAIVSTIVLYFVARTGERWDGWLCGVSLVLMGLLAIKFARLILQPPFGS